MEVLKLQLHMQAVHSKSTRRTMVRTRGVGSSLGSQAFFMDTSAEW